MAAEKIKTNWCLRSISLKEFAYQSHPGPCPRVGMDHYAALLVRHKPRALLTALPGSSDKQSITNCHFAKLFLVQAAQSS